MRQSGCAIPRLLERLPLVTIAARKTDFDVRFDAADTERRYDHRQTIGRTGVLRLQDGSSTTITIADLTREGCRILSPLSRSVGETLVIGIAGVGQVEGQIMWQRAGEHGCRFARPLPAGAVTAAMSSNVHLLADGAPLMPIAAPAPGKAAPAKRVAILALLSLCAWAPAFALFYAIR
jgi:hypothetical protein